MIAPQASLNPLIELSEQLDALRKAYRTQLAAGLLLRALAAALLFDALLLILARLSIMSSTNVVLAGPPLLSIALVAVVSQIRRCDTSILAHRADRELGLQERLLTVVELRGRQAIEPFNGLLLHDTLAQLRRFTPEQAFPIRLRPRDVAIIAIAVLALAALLLVPPPHQNKADRARIQEKIQQEAERVSATADLVAADQAIDTLSRAAVSKALRDTSQNLAKQNSPEKAIAALASGEQQLRGMANGNADDLRQSLAGVADALRREAATREAGTKLAAGNTQGASDSLNSIESQIAQDPTQRSAIAQALANAAGSAARFDPQLGQTLDQASSAVARGDPRLSSALSHAAAGLQQVGQAASKQDAVDKALSQLENSRDAIADSSGAQDGGSTSNLTPEQAANSADKVDAASNNSGQPSSRDGHDPTRSRDISGADQSGQQGAELSRYPPNGDQSGQPGGNSAGTGNQLNSTNIFDPNASAGHREQIGSNQFDRPTITTSDQTALPDQGSATVDYRDVYANYRNRATAVVQDRYIPLDLKELVKGYFSSLDPSR